MGTNHIKVHYGSDNTARYPGKFPVKFGENMKSEPEEKKVHIYIILNKINCIQSKTKYRL